MQQEPHKPTEDAPEPATEPLAPPADVEEPTPEAETESSEDA